MSLNIRSQRVDNNGLEIVGSDGRAFSITRQEVLSHFQAETGTLQNRIAATILWLKQSVVAALGAEQIDIDALIYEFRSSDGVITRASFGRE